MNKPKITKLELSYKNDDRNAWILDPETLPIDANLIQDRKIIHLAPKYVGGNHKHLRTEWFIGTGDLFFFWQDEHRDTHREQMYRSGELFIIEVPPFLPHAVVNESNSKYAVLFEYADGKLLDVESVEVV